MVLGSMLLLSTLPVTWQYDPKGGANIFSRIRLSTKEGFEGEILSVLVDEGKSRSFFAEVVTRCGMSMSGSRYGRLKMVQLIVPFRCLIIRSIM